MIKGYTFIVAKSQVVPDLLLGIGAPERSNTGKVSTLESSEPSKKGREDYTQ